MDQGKQFTSRLLVGRLRRWKIRRRYGAVGSSQSISIVERFWRSMKSECRLGVFAFLLSRAAIERRIRAWSIWYQEHRPHQGLGGRTPDEVLRGRSTQQMQPRFLDGKWRLERRHVAAESLLPVYRLRRAA